MAAELETVRNERETFARQSEALERRQIEERVALAAELQTVRNERDDLVQQSENLATVRDTLTKSVETLAANHGVLTGRVTDLMNQVRTLARQGGGANAENIQAPTQVETAAASRRTAKFVVFSNPRAGSTWLETMLGLLPDVHVNYELKWGVTYVVSDIHVVLDKTSKIISQLLEDMDTDAPVTGSKFVFDVHGLTGPDFRELAGKIGPNVRIIHLTRNYRDIFLSIRRGFHHAPSRTEKLNPRFRDALESAKIGDAKPQIAHQVLPLVCFNELLSFLENDIWIRSLGAAGFPYFQVAYDEVGDKLIEIALFAGSKAALTEIAEVLANPAVTKLPPFEAGDLVANLSELEPLFQSFEGLRRCLVTPQP